MMRIVLNSGSYMKLFVMSVLLCTSCVTVQVADLQKVSKEILPVYTTSLPDAEYTELKYIVASGGVFHTPKKLLRKVSERARKEGADALINVRYDFQWTWPLVSGTAVKFVSGGSADSKK